MSIKVAVRVRPFNERELQRNAKSCIEMQGPTTTITDLNGVPRPFTFDYSFWSHDSYEEDPNGTLVPQEGSEYADQRYVYESLGK